MNKSWCYKVVKNSISKMLSGIIIDTPTEDLAHDITTDFMFSGAFKAFNRDKGRIEDLGCGYAKLRVKQYLEKYGKRGSRFTKLHDEITIHIEEDFLTEFGYRETVQYLITSIPIVKYRVLLRACLEVIQENGKLSIIEVAKKLKRPYQRVKKEVDSMFVWISTNYEYMRP